ncbi:MAG TPA: aminotransferase class IV [Micromonosporaceae bacterium]
MINPTFQQPRFAWQNGRIVPFDQCVVHARSQGAFWGANVFEGVRAYWSAQRAELSLFRLDDHLDRLVRSMKSLHMPARHNSEELRHACAEVLRANEYRQDVHICVVAYFDLPPNLDPLGYTEEVGMHITAIPAPRSAGFHSGVAASISSWRRIGDDTMPPRIKTGANYHNSRLAQHEALRNGFGTTLLLNQRGTVAEAPGSCVMMYREGRLTTPPGTSGVLEGITVATVEALAAEHLGLPVERREIDRTELYVADELFLCGTLAEILPVVSVDRIPVGTGEPGALVRRLQALFDAAARATAGAEEWSTPVWDGAPALR